MALRLSSGCVVNSSPMILQRIRERAAADPQHIILPEGDDPRTSVLNKYCQAHEVKNLFVADGGPFVSQADKNPTWTILALSMRTSEYITEQRRRGEL